MLCHKRFLCSVVVAFYAVSLNAFDGVPDKFGAKCETQY